MCLLGVDMAYIKIRYASLNDKSNCYLVIQNFTAKYINFKLGLGTALWGNYYVQEDE